MISDSRICENIARMALQSLLYEVSTTPKPGLVDRYNQGAHRDMNFFTFMASGAALVCYFYQCAVRGVEDANRDPRALFAGLRTIGLQAERAMFKATGGVNTHKGLIFSLGIICAATSCHLAEERTGRPDTDAICRKVAEMTRGICHRELETLDKQLGLSNGEKLYQKYGFTGIRGEAESGFVTVRSCSLPVLQDLKASNIYPLNDIFAQVLLFLMTVNDDTNIAARSDKDTLDYVKRYAIKILEAGGVFTEVGRGMVFAMDQEFIRRNISPGGSADLLAVTIFLDLLGEEDWISLEI